MCKLFVLPIGNPLGLYDNTVKGIIDIVKKGEKLTFPLFENYFLIPNSLIIARYLTISFLIK